MLLDSHAANTVAYLGLGANLGDPVAQLVAARRRLLQLPMVIELRSSSLYSSSPVGYEEQPDFVNCVVELKVEGTCRHFFSAAQALELEMGRQRDENNQNAARLIDIDLLTFGQLRINEPDLIVPHPRIHSRLFVLAPLKELNVDLADHFETLNSDGFDGQDLHRLSL